jgi:hypothetical protein
MRVHLQPEHVLRWTVTKQVAHSVCRHYQPSSGDFNVKPMLPGTPACTTCAGFVQFGDGELFPDDVRALAKGMRREAWTCTLTLECLAGCMQTQ